MNLKGNLVLIYMVQARPLAVVLPPPKPGAFRVMGAVALSKPGGGCLGRAGPPSRGLAGFPPSAGSTGTPPSSQLVPLPAQWEKERLWVEGGLVFGPGCSRAAGPVRTSRPTHGPFAGTHGLPGACRTEARRLHF